MKLVKNQTKANQQLEAELFLFENFFFLHPHYHPKATGPGPAPKFQISGFFLN